MYRTRNVQIESILRDVVSNPMAKTIIDQGRDAEQVNPTYFIVGNVPLQLTYDNIAETYNYNKSVNLIPQNTSTQHILLGQDTFEFAKRLEGLYGLSNEVPGITNKAIVPLFFVIKSFPTHDIIIYGGGNYIKINNTSSKSLFKNGSGPGMSVALSITSNYDDNGKLSSINFV
jgi:hypothetical protein